MPGLDLDVGRAGGSRGRPAAAASAAPAPGRSPGGGARPPEAPARGWPQPAAAGAAAGAGGGGRPGLLRGGGGLGGDGLPGLAGGLDLLGLDRALLEGVGGGDRVGPGAEGVHLVGELLDLVLGVLELRAPVEGVERAHLDADAAVHAEGEVDREPVQDVAGAGAPALLGGDLLLVGVDVDAPVRALARAEHAHGAVLLDERDHPPGAGGQVRLDVRVLPGRGRPGHRLEGDAEPLEQPDPLERWHQMPTS